MSKQISQRVQPAVNGELAAKRIMQARTTVLLEHCFFGQLALRLDPVQNPNIPTFRTNGKIIEYAPAYAESLTSPERQFVLCHEVWHVAGGHIWKRGNRDPGRWQHATDYATNAMLIKAGMTMPQGGLYDPAYDGKSAEEIYSLLPSDKDGQPTPGEDHGGCCGVQDAPGDEAQQEEERGEWEVAVIQAAQAAKAQGKLPAGLERLIDQIKQSRVDWRAVLRRFVQENCREDYSWKRPATRFIPSGLYMPSLRSESMPPIVIAVDTSGSTVNELPGFAAEINSIMQEVAPETVHVIYADTKVHRSEEFQRGEEIKMEPKGGGGTDFRAALAWPAKKGIEPACMIFLTDLMGTFGDQAPECPLLWVSTMDGEAPFGETIRLMEPR